MYKHNIVLFDAILRDIYRLKYAPVIYVSNKIVYEDMVCYGLYEGNEANENVHTITLCREPVHNKEALFSTMAHEYCHAWQLENNLDVDHTKESLFIKWYNTFKRDYGVDLVEMY